MLSTHSKGAIGELEIAADLLRQGVMVYQPVTEGCRHDLLALVGGVYWRIQCKYAKREKGRITIRFYNMRFKKGKTSQCKYEVADVDIIAAFCPETARCYYVPPSMTLGITCLRTEAARNNQSKRTHLADDYTDFYAAVARVGTATRS